MEMSRRDLIRVGAAGAAGATSALAIPGLIVPADAGDSLKMPNKRFPGDPGPGRIYYGAAKPYGIPRWERRMNARLSMHRMYFQPRNTEGMARRARADIRKGRLPHISTKVPNNDWRAVARGEHDDWLRVMARKLGRIDKPIFFSLHHEPENDRNDYAGRSPRDFVAMHNRALEIFDRYAGKVSVFPILQGWMHDPLSGNNPRDWYVRDANLYGVDIYNGWALHNGKKWRSFAYGLGLVKPFTHGKPIAIGEYGCRTDPRRPGRAARWMRNAYKVAINRNVVSMSYFNSDGGATDGTWELDRERGRVFERKLKARRTR
jgi:hypothetical protein